MRCPICDENMRQVDREDLRMDVCQKCRGAWIEERELEKILDLMTTGVSDSHFRKDHDYDHGSERRDRLCGRRNNHDRDDEYNDGRDHSGHGRHRGVFGRLFDFLE